MSAFRLRLERPDAVGNGARVEVMQPDEGVAR